MAIVTDTLLSGLRTGFNAAFKRGAGRAPGDWKQVATLVKSTNASNTYGWLGQFPKLTEWVGDRASGKFFQNCPCIAVRVPV